MAPLASVHTTLTESPGWSRPSWLVRPFGEVTVTPSTARIDDPPPSPAACAGEPSMAPITETPEALVFPSMLVVASWTCTPRNPVWPMWIVAEACPALICRTMLMAWLIGMA